MEASDVFAQDIGGADDPFAEEWDPNSEEPQARPAGEVPVVDREGNPVEAAAPAHAPADGASVESQEGTRPEPPAPAEAAEAVATDPSGGHPTMTPEQAAANAARYREERGEPDPTPAPEASEATSTESSSAPATEDPTPAGSTPSAAEGSPGASAASSGGGSATGEPQSGGNDGEDAPEPTEAKGKRRYYILRVDGAGKFTQLSWYEDSKGSMVPKGTPGAKRQAVALARGGEEALKIGFAAMGAPPDGAHLVTVAALHFQPKKVKPLPPEPSKQRLQIG